MDIMKSTDQPPVKRVIDTNDEGALGVAWEALLGELETGRSAYALRTEQLDLLIADLVAERHARVDPGPGYRAASTAVTVVTQDVAAGTITLASLRTFCQRDEFGSWARATIDSALNLG